MFRCARQRHELYELCVGTRATNVSGVNVRSLHARLNEHADADV